MPGGGYAISTLSASSLLISDNDWIFMAKEWTYDTTYFNYLVLDVSNTASPSIKVNRV